MTTRVAPHTATKATIKVNGRTYTGTYGSTLDVPDGDAAELEANGWVSLGQVGPTSNRPAAPAKNQRYIDTTLNAVVVYDGVSAWRNMVTGATA